MMDRDQVIRRQMDADAALTRGELAELIAEDIKVGGHVAALRRAARKKLLAIEFGKEHGWTLAEKPFGRLALIRGAMHSFGSGRNDWLFDDLPHEFFDHAYFYRANRRAVAIAAHLYGFNPERLDQFCQTNALKWETPDFPSWWFPGQTTLVVFTKSDSSEHK